MVETVAPPSRVASRLLAGCDPEQREAITSEANPLCVLASAGSGKTRVLTRRIAWRVHAQIAAPRYVLALTFTRKAASELRGRLAALGLPEPVTAGTFHAVALAELRRLAAERGHPAPVVLSSKARLLAAAAGDDTGRDRAALADLAFEIEWAKARCLGPRDYEAQASVGGRRPPVDPARVVATWTRYERDKRRRGVLDFDDLLSVCADELRDDPDFGASARWRYRHFFVDEYQDVNPAQLRLLDAWVGGRDDLCVVGDPQQSIYTWNGSDPRAIVEFADRHRNATVVRLGTNYRSTPEVLAMATSVLPHGTSSDPSTERGWPAEGASAAQQGHSADLTPLAVRSGGLRSARNRPSITAYDDDTEEALGVVAHIRRARRPGASWSSCAVLARTNAQLALFERHLDAAGIPYRSGGGRAFLARPSVRAALASLHGVQGGAALRAWVADLPVDAPGGRDHQAAAEHGAERVSDPATDLDVDLVELGRLAAEYVATDSATSGDGLVAWMEASLRSDPPRQSGDAVDLVTFHRAKGLEWPIVFVTGLEDGLVPIAHARHPEALLEERRLLYVACTRAEEELHVSWAARRTFGVRTSARSQSPYLAAIEAAHRELVQLEEHTPERNRSAQRHVRALLADRAQVESDG